MRIDTLPASLKDRALWCVWKYEQRDGKPTKVPYNPRTGGRAQSNNPATFSDFKTAVAAFGRYQYDGMGICVFPPFAAIDIDHCVTDGELSPMAADIVAHSKSYTEYSPSGKGVRIILTVHDGFKYDKARYYINNQKKGLEVYVSGSTQKFVTITGNKISGDTIQDGESPLRYVCDKYMERAAQKPKTKPQRKPATYTATMTGDYWLDMGMKKDPCLSDYWNGKFPMENESEKDAALMSRLLYWCNADVSRAIDLFKQSPFAMGKDEEHRSKLERDDYLTLTANSVMPQTTAQEDNEAYQRRYIGHSTRTTANSLQERLVQMQPVTAYTWDDKGMGELFADVYRDYCRYNVTAKEWFVFDGKVWKADTGAMLVSQRAKELANALIVYCATIEDERQKADYIKKVSNYGQLRYRETMIKDARDKYFISQADLDADLDLFNCQNGTYNLRTGEFKPHNPQDLLSKVSNVVYDPEARSTRFEQFISDIMQGDTAKINYLQTILGYALTAETNLETCWILYGGTTRNGKSTLVETVSYMMGNSSGYALAMQPQTLAQKQNKDTRQASGDIARLDGCRFLNASEPPKRMLFDVALLKTLLGRDSITARHLFEREYEFIPHFKLFINTNFLPLIQDDTMFSSGRINVVTFDRHFSPQEQDRGLKDELKTPENVSGIFNWCLDGLRRYREHGAEPPEVVQAATAEYRENSDKIGNFITECLIKTGRNTGAGAVYQRFSEWCDDNGYGTESKGNFYDELRNKGIFATSGTVYGRTVRNIVKGYELADSTYQPPVTHNYADVAEIDEELPL